MLTEPESTFDHLGDGDEATAGSGNNARRTNREADGPASIRDYVREGWKDIKVDLLLWKDDLAKVGRNSYRGTRRAVVDSARVIRRDVGEQWQELRADLSVQQRLLQQDMHDFLKATQQLKSQVAQRHQTSQPKITKQQLMQQLRDYEATLQKSESFATELNDLLASKLSSCQEMMNYYEARPKLHEYTLTKELGRIQYTVFTHTGEKLTSTDAIQKYASSKNSNTTSTSMEDPKHTHLLWRAANQSLFGDVITTLTTPEGLVRPQFHTAAHVTDIHMTIDFARDTPHITAECYLQVQLSSPSSRDDTEDSHEKLVLAGALVGVYFCPAQERMEAKILHLSPSSSVDDGPLLSDEAVEHIAESILQGSS